MNNTTTNKTGINWGMGLTTILAAGVLVGCEYCEPLLIGMVAYHLSSAIVTRFSKAEASQAGTLT